MTIANRYEEKGSEAACADVSAGNDLRDVDDTAVLQWLGLDEGGAEWRALCDEHGDGADAVINEARESALRGYHARVASHLESH